MSYVLNSVYSYIAMCVKFSVPPLSQYFNYVIYFAMLWFVVLHCLKEFCICLHGWDPIWIYSYPDGILPQGQPHRKQAAAAGRPSREIVAVCDLVTPDRARQLRAVQC